MVTRKTAAAARQAWTPAEQRALIAAYNAMRLADFNGVAFSKAAINRWLRGDWAPAQMPTTYEQTTDTSLQGVRDCQVSADIQLGPLAQGVLAARTHGSVEAKLMNISGARDSLGLPILKGYKPAPNYQRSLVELVQEAES